MANASFGVNILPKANTEVTIGNSDSPWTIVSPSLTGTPTAPTAVAGTNNTQIATTAFVQSAIPSISGKADKVTSATNGNFAGLDSNGNLTDSGSKASDFLTSHQDITGKLDKDQGTANAGKFMKVGADGKLTPDNVPDPTGKADKVLNATNGNFAGLDENGNLTDSGHKHSDYLTSHQDISGKADKVTSATAGNVATLDGNGNLTDSGKTLGTSVPSNAVFTDTDNTFVATYGTTTLAQVLTAYNAGKIITCYKSDNTTTYNLTRYTSDTFYFKSFGSSAATNYGVYVDADGWHANSYGYKITQTAVSDPTASGNGITFIDSISQATTGVITPTKKTVQSASASQDGLMSSSDYSKLSGIASGATANSFTVASGTASSGSWSSSSPYTQSVAVTGVTASNIIVVTLDSSATSSQFDEYVKGKLLCTAQTTGYITVTCYGTKPTGNIPLSVLILN